MNALANAAADDWHCADNASAYRVLLLLLLLRLDGDKMINDAQCVATTDTAVITDS